MFYLPYNFVFFLISLILLRFFFLVKGSRVIFSELTDSPSLLYRSSTKLRASFHPTNCRSHISLPSKVLLDSSGVCKEFYANKFMLKVGSASVISSKDIELKSIVNPDLCSSSTSKFISRNLKTTFKLFLHLSCS